jgi:hypothetical protein
MTDDLPKHPTRYGFAKFKLYRFGRICESLLIALRELKIVSEQETRDLLTDVVAAHKEAAHTARAPEKHQAVVGIVQRILAGKDGVPF